MKNPNPQFPSQIPSPQGQGACEGQTKRTADMNRIVNLIGLDRLRLRAKMDDVLWSLMHGTGSTGSLLDTVDCSASQLVMVLAQLMDHGYVVMGKDSATGLNTWGLTRAGRDSFHRDGVALLSRRAQAGITCTRPCTECSGTGIDPSPATPAEEEVQVLRGTACLGCGGLGYKTDYQSDRHETAEWAWEHGRAIEVSTGPVTTVGVPDYSDDYGLTLHLYGQVRKPGTTLFDPRPWVRIPWREITGVRIIPAV